MGCGELTSPPSWGGHEVTTPSPWNAEGTRVYHTPQVCTHRHTRPDTHTQTCTHTNTCTHVHAHHAQQAGAAHMRTHGHTGWHRHGHTHLLQGAQRWPGGGVPLCRDLRPWSRAGSRSGRTVAVVRRAEGAGTGQAARSADPAASTGRGRAGSTRRRSRGSQTSCSRTPQNVRLRGFCLFLSTAS